MPLLQTMCARASRAYDAGPGRSSIREEAAALHPHRPQPYRRQGGEEKGNIVTHGAADSRRKWHANAQAARQGAAIGYTRGGESMPPWKATDARARKARPPPSQLSCLSALALSLKPLNAASLMLVRGTVTGIQYPMGVERERAQSLGHRQGSLLLLRVVLQEERGQELGRHCHRL